MTDHQTALAARIIDSCAKQIQKQGIKGFTMDDLAKDLGISKKTIYKHFSSKQEIVHAYMKTSLEDNITKTMMAVEMAPNLIEKIQVALLSYYRYVLPIEVLDDIANCHPDDWKMIEEQRQFKLKLFNDLVQEGVASGEFREDIHWEVLALMLQQSTRAILDYRFLHHNHLSVNDAIRQMLKIILEGIVCKGHQDWAEGVLKK